MSLPAPPTAIDPGPPPGPPPRRFGRWRRRSLLINIGLALLVVIILVVALIVAFAPRQNANPVRTVAVTRGTVTAQVTASGNAESSLATPVSFTANGVLTSVGVVPGDSVIRGQVLATIDGASADTTRRTALAQLDNARAALAQAAAGPTDVKKQQDQLAITQAQQAVGNANTSVTQAQQQLSLDQKSTDTAIDNAKQKLSNDDKTTQQAVNQAKQKLATDTITQNALVSQATCTTTASASAQPSAQPSASSAVNSLLGGSSSSSSASSPTTTAANASGGSVTRGSSRSAAAADCPAKTNAENTRRSVLQADQAAVTNAQQSRNATLDASRQAVTTAEQNQDATILKDNQAVESAKQQVTTAQGNVTSAQLAAEADLHPQTPEQIAQAQANVDQAQASYDAAQRGVDDTTLVAPQDGVVLSVAGKVGEVSSGGGTSGASSGTSGTGTGGAASSSASTTATASGTGFIVIANLSKLAVTANIAEADASKIKLGQPATITFPADNATATGAVTQLTPQSIVSNNVVQYPVQVSLDTAPAGVGVGSTANMSITTGSKVGVLVAPTSAITTVGNRHTVVVRRGEQDQVVPVETGLVGDTTTEIVSGVQAGDQLVLPTVATSTTNGFPRGGGGGGGG